VRTGIALHLVRAGIALNLMPVGAAFLPPADIAAVGSPAFDRITFAGRAMHGIAPTNPEAMRLLL